MEKYDFYFYVSSASELCEILAFLGKDPQEQNVVLRTYETLPEAENTGFTIVVIEDADLLACAVDRKTVRTKLIFYGSEEEIAGLPKKLQAELTDMWSKSAPGNLLCFRAGQVMRLIENEHRSWLNENLLHTFIDSLPDMVWFKDAEGIHTLVNDEFCRIVNKSKDRVQGQGHCSIWEVPLGEEYACRESDAAVVREGRTCTFEEPVVTADGMKQFRTYKSPYYDIDGSILGTMGMGHDISDLNNLGSELNILTESIPLPLVSCDENWHITRTNNHFKRAFSIDRLERYDNDYHAWKEMEFTENKVERLGHGVRKSELSVKNPNPASPGSDAFYTLMEQPVLDFFGIVKGYYCIFIDITKTRAFEKEIVNMANTDFLTKLFNRRYFYQKLRENIAKSLSLLYFDLNKFKYINDTFGHAKGDEVLCITADCIRKHFSDGICARMGGDEFVVLLLQKPLLETVERRVAVMQEDLAMEFSKDFGMVSISVGISQADGLEKDVDALLAESDARMYRQKELSR